MHTGTIYLIILLSILDLILLNADTYYSINTTKSRQNDKTATKRRLGSAMVPWNSEVKSSLQAHSFRDPPGGSGSWYYTLPFIALTSSTSQINTGLCVHQSQNYYSNTIITVTMYVTYRDLIVLINEIINRLIIRTKK